MSGVSRLRQIFAAKPSIASKPSIAATTTVVHSFHDDDFTTPEGLRNVVESFKKSCENNQFRRRARTYGYTVRRLAEAQAYPMIEEIIESQKKYKEISYEGFVVRLISLYGKARMFDHARALFDEMPSFNCRRTTNSFSALLSAALNAERYDVVHDLFRQLPSQYSFQPDVASYNVVIHAFCKIGSTDSAISMLSEMEELGLKPDWITFNTLIGGFYKQHGYDEAERIWALLRAQNNFVPTVGNYLLRLGRMVHDGRVAEAVKVVDEMMREDGVEPDVRCFNVLVKGFCGDGKVEEAKHWYEELVRCGCVANRATYETLVPFLLEKGDFNMAFELCKAAVTVTGKLPIDAGTLKRAVEEFVAEGMTKEVTELVVLAKKRKMKIELPLNQE